MLALIGIPMAALALVSFGLWKTLQSHQRAAYIRGYELPRGLFDKLRKRRPELTLKECQLVAQALRQFFMAHLKSGRQFVSMPSQVADDLWHEFILHTKNYDAFCQKAFGRFLHHTPAVVLGAQRDANAGLRRCWWFACREDNIDPRKPTRLPLLFALDGKLRVADGFHYVPDCGSVRREGGAGNVGTPYCGADFSSNGIDGSTDGFGDHGGGGNNGGFGDGGGDAGSSGDGGSCGGGGCGGGD
jgi:hypothetical protein